MDKIFKLIVVILISCHFHTFAQEASKQTLKVSGTAKFGTHKITILKVLSDNRCPEGAQCLVAGSVKLLVKIDGQKKEWSTSQMLELKTKGDSLQLQVLESLPNRLLNKEIDKKDYSFTISCQYF